MNTLLESYENWYSEWKNHADSKYDSQFSLRAIPDYEPLSPNFSCSQKKAVISSEVVT